MGLPAQINLIKQSVKEWNSWRQSNSNIEVDLSGANLAGLDLSKAQLWNANLKDSNLVGTKLRKSDCRGVNLQGSNLTEADFSESDLRNSNFSTANLTKTNLTKANLIGVNFTQAQAYDANFTEANLTATCLKNWLINEKTNFNALVCDYVYFEPDKSNRYPEKSNFAHGEFVKFLRKDLIVADSTNLTFSAAEDNYSEHKDVDDSHDKLEVLSLAIMRKIDEVSREIPESPTSHVKIATKVLQLLQKDQLCSAEVESLREKPEIYKLEELVDHPAIKLIIVGLKK